MRASLVALVLAAGCTASNPDYCGPRGWRDCPQAYIYVQPDLYGYVLAPDMTVLPDPSHPDLATPPDFLPPPDLTCGLPYDNLNCGKCGKACGKGTACSMGACVACVADCSDPATLGKVCCPDAVYVESSNFACANETADDNTCAPCGLAGVRCCPGNYCRPPFLRCIDRSCR